MTRYIPRKIHMIWFGGNAYPPVVEMCIKSWREFAPNYEIKVWDERNFDINCNAYVTEAYQCKKWAFVSDYVRLYALYNEGGVYLDSDVKVVRPFDELLENEHAVTGYSTRKWIPAGFMASEAKNEWIKVLLDYHTNKHFVLPNGRMFMKANNPIITEVSQDKCNFKVGDMWIERGSVRLYPREYFHPYKKEVINLCEDNLINIENYFNIDPEKTYTIHCSMGSWSSGNKGLMTSLKHITRKFLPQSIIDPMQDIYYKYKNWSV